MQHRRCPATKSYLYFTGDLQAKLVLIRSRYHLKSNRHATHTQAHGDVRCRKTQHIKEQQTVNARDIEQGSMKVQSSRVEGGQKQNAAIPQQFLCRNKNFLDYPSFFHMISAAVYR